MEGNGPNRHFDAFRRPHPVQAVFSVLVLAVLAIPFVGMLWASTESTTENRTLAPLPSLVEEGSPNVTILSDLGAYFEDHYAYRNELVTANALIRTPLLSSPTDQVVIGTDGWLYYGGTLNDYLSTGTGSVRANRTVAYNLSLVQGYVESYGSEFLFTLAPNKNSLYSEDMPFFYQEGAVQNIDLLEPWLEEYGVRYVDLFEAFEGESDTLYCLRDSHWTNKGAALAADALLAESGREASFYGREAVERDDYQGDLESMLYPSLARTEPNWYYEGINDEEGGSGASWRYVEGETVEDSWIETSGQGDGTLLVYRDSFGNALLPYLATASSKAFFTKYVPYDVGDVVQVDADLVIVERAERHVLDLATDPPIMPAPRVRMGSVAGEGDSCGFVSLRNEGSFAVVEGLVPNGEVGEDARFFVQVENLDGSVVSYAAYGMTVDAEEAGRLSGGACQEQSDYGWRAYVDQDALQPGGAIRVVCAEGDATTVVAAGEVSS